MLKGVIIAVAIAVVAVPIAVYTISPVFIDTTIDEEFPVPRPAETGMEENDMKEKDMAGMEDAGMDATDMAETESAGMAETQPAVPSTAPAASEPMTEPMDVVPDAPGEAGMSGETAGMAADSGPMTADQSEAAYPALQYMGQFIGVGDGIHDAGGSASIYEIDEGMSVLRLEDFFSTNGPGLRVYLSTDKGASDYVSLGDLKANRGNQNYDIPAGTDLEKYNKVLIWCEPFRVLFGSAEVLRAS